MSEDLPKALRLLTQKQLAQLLNVSERTLERWRVEGRGPRFVALGPRRRGYRLSDVEDWTQAQTFGSTAEAKRDMAEMHSEESE
jgi:predicted DNA-binding transcriptional regulator AlpA